MYRAYSTAVIAIGFDTPLNFIKGVPCISKVAPSNLNSVCCIIGLTKEK